MTSIIPKAETIKITRIKKGLSLRGLAIKSKAHYSTISNMENGKCAVTPRIAKSICDALHQKFEDLFEIVDGERRINL